MENRLRAESYHQRFPNFPELRSDERWLDGVWILGNNYRSKSGYYGSYPPQYLERVMSLFPEIKLDEILHLFSGSLGFTEQSITLDILPKLNPRVVGNAIEMPFKNESFSLVLADPPYSKNDAEIYGTSYPNKRLVLREAARVTKIGGYLAWLDTQLPMFSKNTWHWFGAIALVRSTNHRIRLLSLFERVQT